MPRVPGNRTRRHGLLSSTAGVANPLTMRCSDPAYLHWKKSPHIGSNRPEARQGPCPTGPSNALVDCFRIRRNPELDRLLIGYTELNQANATLSRHKTRTI